MRRLALTTLLLASCFPDADQVQALEEHNAELQATIDDLEERLAELEAQLPSDEEDDEDEEALADAEEEAGGPTKRCPDGTTGARCGSTAPSPAPRPVKPMSRPAPEPEPEPEPERVFDGPTGTLQVVANDKGRAVYVDGEKTRHVTPALFEWSAGVVQVKVEGYAAQEVRLEEDQRRLVGFR